LGVRFIAAVNPRLPGRVGRILARRSPSVIAAVTGTNGKTSVARSSADLGVSGGPLRPSPLGTDAPSGHVSLATRSDPVRLHAELARLKNEGVDHLALEALGRWTA
jgi:UDP-N-acetylmuramoyl-L-alanyl-D-glutamate--2,6-diaminopimelate ligase